MLNGGVKLIIDVTGVFLLPGNNGKDCPGNGKNPNIECCCDECDYMLCCLTDAHPEYNICTDISCPHSQYNSTRP